MQTVERYRVEVKHRWSIPKRYIWEIHEDSRVLSIVESCVDFSSWEEASNAGKIALAAFQAGTKERKPPD